MLKAQKIEAEKNVSPSKGKKSAGSSCSSISQRSTASTASGSSGTPSGRSEVSDSKSVSSSGGSNAVDPQGEPMKVLQCDPRLHAGIQSFAANMPLQQARSAVDIHPQLVANMTAQLRLANTPTQTIERTSQNELDVLKESIAVLTMRCLRLQERVDMGDESGPPGVLWKKDGPQNLAPPGVFLPQNNRPHGYATHAPQVPLHVARGYRN
jgi:hypothetical protein